MKHLNLSALTLLVLSTSPSFGATANQNLREDEVLGKLRSYSSCVVTNARKLTEAAASGANLQDSESIRLDPLLAAENACGGETTAETAEECLSEYLLMAPGSRLSDAASACAHGGTLQASLRCTEKLAGFGSEYDPHVTMRACSGGAEAEQVHACMASLMDRSGMNNVLAPMLCAGGNTAAQAKSCFDRFPVELKKLADASLAQVPPEEQRDGLIRGLRMYFEPYFNDAMKRPNGHRAYESEFSAEEEDLLMTEGKLEAMSEQELARFATKALRRLMRSKKGGGELAGKLNYVEIENMRDLTPAQEAALVEDQKKTLTAEALGIAREIDVMEFGDVASACGGGNSPQEAALCMHYGIPALRGMNPRDRHMDEVLAQLDLQAGVTTTRHRYAALLTGMGTQKRVAGLACGKLKNSPTSSLESALNQVGAIGDARKGSPRKSQEMALKVTTAKSGRGLGYGLRSAGAQAVRSRSAE